MPDTRYTVSKADLHLYLFIKLNILIVFKLDIVQNRVHLNSNFRCISLFRGFMEDACKDITFGACLLDRSNIIKNGSQADAVTCQEACNNHEECHFFRFSDQFNSKCNFLREEYRRGCDVIGGSLVGV